MISEDILKKILIAPAKEGADSLLILTGYASPSMATWLITALYEENIPAVSIHLIVGMATYDGLNETIHEEFKELHGKNFGDGHSSFTCSYSYGQPVHANLYIWIKKGTPYKAYISSACFMQKAFLSNRMELAEKCVPTEAQIIFDKAESNSIFCNHSEVGEYIQFTKYSTLTDIDEKNGSVLKGAGIEHVKLSLLSKSGNTGSRSGLNWGQRSRRNKNQAYIPLPKEIALSGFFPLNKQQFSAHTDDGHILVLRVEQQGDKAITTPLCNADIGEYFRNRLGLKNGAYVDKVDLLNYGRTDVDFYKIDDEEFYMDFSVAGTD